MMHSTINLSFLGGDTCCLILLIHMILGHVTQNGKWAQISILTVDGSDILHHLIVIALYIFIVHPIIYKVFYIPGVSPISNGLRSVAQMDQASSGSEKHRKLSRIGLAQRVLNFFLKIPYRKKTPKSTNHISLPAKSGSDKLHSLKQSFPYINYLTTKESSLVSRLSPPRILCLSSPPVVQRLGQ